jgi:NADH-quinone oxidoreductase subunit F
MAKIRANKSAQETFERLYKKSASACGGTSPNERIHINVGTATCGRAAGALETLQVFRDEIARRNIDATISEVGCRGYCYAEPMVVISKPGYPPICYGYVTPGVAERLVSDFILGGDPCLEFALGALEENEQIPAIFDQPRFKYEKRHLLRNCGGISPDDIEQYISIGGYGALAKALDMTPQRIIDEIGKSIRRATCAMSSAMQTKATPAPSWTARF